MAKNGTNNVYDLAERATQAAVDAQARRLDAERIAAEAIVNHAAAVRAEVEAWAAVRRYAARREIV